MAAETVADDIRVVEIRRSPGDRRMTIVAIIATCDMRRVLAGGCNTVMTGAAGADDLCVVDG